MVWSIRRASGGMGDPKEKIGHTLLIEPRASATELPCGQVYRGGGVVWYTWVDQHPIGDGVRRNRSDANWD